MKIILKKTSLILIAISLIACELGSDYPLANKNEENKNGAVSSTSNLASEAGIDIMKKGVSRIVEVSESQIRFAIRCFFTDTHNVAEGAGAATLAAVLKEKQKMESKRVAVILTGGNIDNSVYQDVLNEKCEGKSYL